MGAILSLLGWSFDKRKMDEIASRHDKIVLVYPHTSSWDGFIAILLKYAYLNKYQMKLMLWSGIYDKFPKLFAKLGFVRVDNNKKSGTINTIGEQLKKFNKFLFVISPEGSRELREEFRSGFYYIAKTAGASLMVANLNYSSHEVELFEPWLPGDSPEEEIKKIKHLFSLTPPLYPENTIYARSFIGTPTRSCKYENLILLLSVIVYFILVLIILFHKKL